MDRKEQARRASSSTVQTSSREQQGKKGGAASRASILTASESEPFPTYVDDPSLPIAEPSDASTNNVSRMHSG